MTTFALGTDTYAVDLFPLPVVTDTTPAPLDLVIASGTVWLCCEFDRRIYSLPTSAVAGTPMTAIEIPAPTSPIFRTTLFGLDLPHAISQGGEQIAVGADGSIWVSQGGHNFYTGVGDNWSRIVRRLPNGTWAAYTLPVNSAGATGFLVDGSQLYVGTSGLGSNAVYVTRPAAWHADEIDPTTYPPKSARWSTLLDFGPQLAMPSHFVRLADKRLAVTLYTDNAVLLIDGTTVTRVTLTAPSKPWVVKQGPLGGIWVTEDAGLRITRIDPTTLALTSADISGAVTSGERLHSLVFDGFTPWFSTYNQVATGDAHVGRCPSAGTFELSPALPFAAGGVTGLARDSSGNIWAACFRQKTIARFTKQ